jgi:hypothetical protein
MRPRRASCSSATSPTCVGEGALAPEIWIRSTSSNQRRLAIYGGRRSGDGDYTILVINKTAEALESPLALSGLAAAGRARVWRWTGGAINHVANRDVAGGFTATYPARSLTLLVIPA